MLKAPNVRKWIDFGRRIRQNVGKYMHVSFWKRKTVENTCICYSGSDETFENECVFNVDETQVAESNRSGRCGFLHVLRTGPSHGIIVSVGKRLP